MLCISYHSFRYIIEQLLFKITKLKRQLTLSRDAAFEEVQLRNKFLTEKLEDLERVMKKRQMSASQEFGVPGSAAYAELKDKEDKLQKQIIQLSEENIELKFEVEQSRKDIPRLKVSTCPNNHSPDYEIALDLWSNIITMVLPFVVLPYYHLSLIINFFLLKKELITATDVWK